MGLIPPKNFDAQDPHIRLGAILLPPECRPGNPRSIGAIVTNEQINYAMQWIRSLPMDDPTFKNKINWMVDLKQLKMMVGLNNDLDEKRARIVSDYIWEHREQEPDYYQLLAYLKTLDDVARNQLIAANKAQKQKKKTKRKQAKASRKRNRRK